ncbi:MAG: hypothetical protein OEY62_08890, partial [Acidimicrobiia bacterium]|nr:hypothetical protein [Acidimicrobiia bacterium]
FGAGRSRYIPYETRMAYRDARQAPVNYREWRANAADRRSIRRGTAPEYMRPPPRGFTASRRQRSAARIGRQERARRRRAPAHSTGSAARERVERVLVGSSSGSGDR